MRTLEVHRYTMRRKPGQHLSQDGIALARLVGGVMGPFSLVVTSPIPRAVQTSIAMGFEVHETLDALGDLPSNVLDGLGWPSPFARVARAVTKGLRCSEFAELQADLWRSIVERVPDSEQALVVTHGAFVELGEGRERPGGRVRRLRGRDQVLRGR
jgi:broad specificity phosphatase PhoE